MCIKMHQIVLWRLFERDQTDVTINEYKGLLIDFILIVLAIYSSEISSKRKQVNSNQNKIERRYNQGQTVNENHLEFRIFREYLKESHSASMGLTWLISQLDLQFNQIYMYIKFGDPRIRIVSQVVYKLSTVHKHTDNIKYPAAESIEKCVPQV